MVSDPENEDKDCEELGNAEVDLKMVNYNNHAKIIDRS